MRINNLMTICAIVFCSGMAMIPGARAEYIDTINEFAATARPERPIVHDSFANIGWYYTPVMNYTLTGIYTKFGPVLNATEVNSITVQIQSDRPANGGTILREATFEAPQAPGGIYGGSFAPIELVAGETYFVDFLDVRGMGVNVGTWDFDASLTQQLSLGATMNLGAFYRDELGQFATASTNPWGIAADGITRISGTAPILLFEGFAVPEPSSLIILGVGIGALALRRRSSEVHFRP